MIVTFPDPEFMTTLSADVGGPELSVPELETLLQVEAEVQLPPADFAYNVAMLNLAQGYNESPRCERWGGVTVVDGF